MLQAALSLPTSLPDRLAQFIRKLCGAIGDYGLKHRSVLPVLNLAATRLFRLSAQSADLVAKVREGRLPAQRTTRRRADPAPARALPPGSEAEASPSVPDPSVPELPRLPRDFGWLLRLTPGDHWVRGYRGYMSSGSPTPSSWPCSRRRRGKPGAFCARSAGSSAFRCRLSCVCHRATSGPRPPPLSPMRRPPGQARGQAPAGRARDRVVGCFRPSWASCRTRSWTEGWLRPGLACCLFRSRIDLSRPERADSRP